jgi:beta-N-acetylhexosaminidase
VILAAFAQAILAAFGLAAPATAPQDPLAGLSARHKAALVVVSGLPSPPRGVAGVLVQRWNTKDPRPGNALVFVDQEGGDVRAFRSLPPSAPASSYRTRAAARQAGRATARALRRVGVHVDLAPVLDLKSGPLGSRHFDRPALGLAFAHGLADGRLAGCAKHFPGLGSTAVSTDLDPTVRGHLIPKELAAFRSAIDAGIPCVMTSHAIYKELGPGRALTRPKTYQRLRAMGFEGVAITDSLSIVQSGDWTLRWTVEAIRAGADLVLFTSSKDAREAVHALVPLARKGLLDEHLLRVLALRAAAGLPPPGRW